ncbi:MAG: hypothetical protein M3Z25_18625 [Actinomycetota bacterium]|nr:hypothetical protein [Actinomycetota bacterium]
MDWARSAKLARALERYGLSGMAQEITDEMIEHFAVVARWDEMSDALADRYRGTAKRIVLYLAAEGFEEDPKTMGRWGEIARAIRQV